MPRATISRRRLLTMLGSAAFMAACSGPPEPGLPLAPVPTPAAHPPVAFPRDEAPHNDLTEWWYYTGHLESADNRRWGFELVTFQIQRATLQPYYVAHFAVTDRQRGLFRYEDRQSQGAQAQPPEGFSLDVGGWRMAGLLGNDTLQAAMSAYGIDLRLSTRRPPVLHDGGLVTFGPAGDSYYYSRTRMEIAGSIDDHGERVPVKGLAWFDKQWGNFLVMGGGWDWFSMQLDDGSDLMLNLIRNQAGQTTIAYGTYVAPDGTFKHLTGNQFEVSVLGTWASPHTGITYPSGWRATVREPALDVRVAPVLSDQELDARTSTSMVYWEGAQTIVGTLNGQPIAGQGYVELVGY
ncbi:MAG TPA: lipocalin family protein [Chloroflexota bacterium]|nr:lipocalin family protein [Chloroflexota bacterium]